MSGLTQQLAAFVAAPDFGPQYEEACRIARTGFTDTIATMMAGSTEPVVGMLLQHYEGFQCAAQEAPVPFARKLLPAMYAASINGTSAHALDYDDVALSGHPSTVLVPAILADGHVAGASGLDALRAYVIGYEVWAELFGRETDQYHLKGWHPTAVLGTVGATAALAWLNRLPEEQVRNALAISASMAGGMVANFGTMTKPLHAGRAAACAVEAVQLAQLGLTAAPDVFEHRAGFLNALSPAGQVDRERPAAGLGAHLRITDIGLAVKQYPMCYSAHRGIDGLLDILKREKLKPGDVRKVTTVIGRTQASMLRNHAPQTGLEAKFSMEFAVASALTAQRVGLNELTDAFVNRPDVREQFGKVSIECVDTQSAYDPAFSRADRVVVETSDGRSFDSGEVEYARGDPKLPLDEAGLRAKFADCLAVAGFDDAAAATLYAKVAALEKLGNLRELF